MNRRNLTLAATATVAALTVACAPPQANPLTPPPSYASACDPNHKPNNTRSWCMVWTRHTDGARINPGPVWEYQFDASHGGATVIISAVNWRSAP